MISSPMMHDNLTKYANEIKVELQESKKYYDILQRPKNS